MFRKIAIALVAASVLAAPVLAQTQSTTSDSKVAPATPAPTTSSAQKAEKKAITKHRMVIRHHRHGAKMAKYTKSHGAKMVKRTKYGAKYGKYSRHMGGARTAPKHAYGRASMKSISPKGAAKPSSSTRGAKPGLD